MQLIERFHTLTQAKYGKAIVFGTITVVFALVSIGMYKVMHSIPEAKSERKPKEVIVAQDQGKEVAELSPGGEMSSDQEASFNEKFGEIDSAHVPSKVKGDCDNRFPDHGYVHLYRPYWEKSPTPRTELEIDNMTTDPIWVSLIHPTAEYQIVGYMIHPGKSILKRVNIGLYGIDFSNGKKWCNFLTGMLDGKKLGLAKNTALTERHSTALTIKKDENGNLTANVIQLSRRSINEGTDSMLIDKTKIK